METMLRVADRASRISFGFLLLILLTMSAAAQTNAAGPREREARIQALQGTVRGAAAGRQLRLSLSKEHYLRSIGTPSGGAISIDGAGLSPEGQARAFIAQWGDLFFKKTPAIDFKTEKINQSGSRSHVRMSQTYRGLKVFASGLTVQVNKAAGVESVFADVLREAQDLESGKLSTTPAVSADAARKAAATAIKDRPSSSITATTPELMIFEPKLLKLKEPVQLVWQTIVTDPNDPTVREQVLVNAQTGAVALHYTLIMDARNRMIYNANNVPGVDPGTLVRSEGQPASGVSDADLAYTYFGDTYDYYYQTHGRDSLNNAGYTLSGTVLYCPSGETPPYGNAFWDGSRMYFGQGFSAADDVVAHELTHGVTQYESNLNYYGQPGAINESLSDMWGEWIDLTNGSGTDTDAVRWLLGEDIPGVGVIRSMKNPPAYGDPDRMGSPLWYTGTGDNGGVHTNSGVGNKLAYLLSDGDTFNMQTVSALGITTTSKLVYECQANLLTVSSDYGALANALAQAAINLGYSTAVRDNVDRACIATEIKELPDNVSGVRATSATGSQNISMTWVNPTAAGFQSVVVRRGAAAYPLNPTDGDAVYSGSGSACTDGPFTIGSTCYYSIWAYYGGASYSYALNVQVTVGAESPDWFTELFDASNNDLDNHRLILTPGSAVNTYSAATEDATSFPTDPAGGTVLNLTDDSYMYCALAEGRQFSLYGAGYAGFYVGSNGYITFGSADSSYGESFANHFSKPRIAGLYDDLSPSSNVSWKQLSDRAVVTWNAVREYGTSNLNSFQIEVFFDGKITITWLAMGSTDGLAGVSAGSGIPAGFVESDLTAYPAPVYDDLQVYPLTAVNATGFEGGPFTPSQAICTLTNRDAANSLPWSASFSAPWMTVTPTGGTLPPGGTVDVTIQFNSAANQLAPGDFAGLATFTNLASSNAQTRSFSLHIDPSYGRIDVSDSIPPARDLAMPFGQLELGRSRTEHVTLANTDTAHSLIITNIALNGYLLEDFNDGLAQGWVPEVPSQWQVVDNKYRAQAGTGLRVQSLYGDQTWTDCSAQATLSRTGYMSSAADLVVRASSDFSWRDGTGSAYGVGISGDGAYYIIKWISGTYTFLKDWTESSYLNTGTTANVIRVVIQGSSIKVYANGNLLWSGTDSSIPGPGRVGLLGYTGAESATVHYFDDVLIDSNVTATGTISPEQANDNRRSHAGAGDPTHTPGDWKRSARRGATSVARLAAPIQPQVVSSFSLNGLPVFPATLGPGQSLTFGVVYTPAAIDQHRNTMRIESNDVSRPRVLVDLSGEGIADHLAVSPATGLESGGHPGGPFSPASTTYQLSNTGASSINWSASKTAAWLTLSSPGGTLAAGGQGALTVSLNAQANALAEGEYADDVTITNTTSGAVQTRHVALSVYTTPEVWVNPATFTQTLIEGTWTTRTLQIGNSGDRVLNFTLSSQETSRTTAVALDAASGLPPAGHSFTKLVKGVSFNPNRLLVRFDSSVAPAKRAGVLASAGGGTIVQSYTLVPGLTLVQLPQGMTVEDGLAKFNGAAGIKYAEPDYELKAFANIPNDPRFGELWAMHNTGQTGGTADADIDAPEAWDIHTGSAATVVAVIDTGIDYTHPDLASNMWTNAGEIAGNGIDDDGNGYIDDIHGYDFVNVDGNPMDDEGHGTHCSGTIGARGNDAVGVAGVSWRVSLMGVKFLNSSGSGSTSNAVFAVQYATRMGAKIMSNSWGGGAYSQSLKDAIDAAGAKGMLFIAAAGNDNGNNNDTNPVYPCSYASENIVSVMSTTNTDARSSFSNFGPTSVDLGAPGSSILSCVPGGGYATKSGTSMATPHVAGGAALVWSLNPTLSHAEVKRVLMASVDPTLSGQCASNGRMNIAKALAIAGEPWIRLRPTSGAVPVGSSTNINVGLYATDLTVGRYSGEILVNSDDGNTPQLVVPVHLTVIPDFMTLTPSTDFTMPSRYAGAPPDPAEETSSTLSNTGPASSWTATGSEPWLTVEPASGLLGQGESVQVRMRLNSAVGGLAVGEHIGTVTVTNTATGKTLTRKIKVNVIPVPPRPPVPNNPTPEDGAAGVACDTSLSWNTFFHVIEDFEDGGMSEYFGLSGGTNTINTESAHDGDLGLSQNSEWIYRTDPAVTVAQGQMISYWIQPCASGRIYCGFGAGTGGTYSVVAGMNSSEFLIQLNSGWSYSTIASATQSWTYNHWYRMEVEWASGGTITARLYDSDGTTLLNTIKASDNTYASGGIAFRSFGAQHYIDTVTRSKNIGLRTGAMASAPGTGIVNGSGEAVTYDVYLDTGVTTPTTLIYSGGANACRPQPALRPNSAYRWRVEARNIAGSTHGPVWSFTTSDNASSGTLMATINPAWAVQDGAKWHLLPIEEAPNPVVWHDTGETVSYAAGNYTLVFKTLPGWQTPSDQPVAISNGTRQTKVGIYNPRSGNLTVTVNPPACSEASWRLKGREEAPNPIVWHNGGATVSYPAGTYTITFQPKEGWVTPGDQTVTITENQTSTAYAAYGSGPGSRFVVHLEAGYNPVGPAVGLNYTAQAIIDDVNSDGGTALRAYRYLHSTGWQSHDNGSSSNNFTINNGYGYFVKTATASQWIQESPAISSPLTIILSAGYNPLSLPGWAPNTKAEALGSAINQQGGSVIEVIRFVRESGVWQSHVMGLPFNNFDIIPGVCYILKCAGSSNYVVTAPAAQAQPAAEADAKNESEQPIAVPAGVMPAVTTTPVQASNVTQNSFTVSWTTDVNASGYIEFGTTAGLGRSVSDVRGIATSSSTHFINVTGLEANTRYYFDVITNGVRDNNGGAHYSVTTGADIGLPPFGTAYGRVFIYNHVNSATGTIVHVQVEDQNRAGTFGRSAMLSALVLEGGYWCVPLGAIRAADGGSFFSYSTGDKVILVARGGSLGEMSLPVDASVCAPAADLVLNRGPKAVNESVSTMQNTALMIPVLANDSDPDGDPLSITNVTTPAQGTTFLNVNGKITYRPATNYFGTDSFQYTVSDGRGGSATATVTVTVNQVFLPAAIIRAPYSDNIICVGRTETLDGSSSYDPRGRSLTYQWTIVRSPSGARPSLGNAASSKATIKADVAGFYKVRLVVGNGTQTGYADLVLEARFPAPLTADFNNDNKVDVLDLLIILSHYTSKGKAYDARYDLNRDGKIDSSDLTRVVACFGQSTYPQRAALSPRPQASFSAEVSLLPSSAVVRQGETFTVSVYVKGYTMGAVQVGLEFDDKCLNYLNWADLNLLNRGESGAALRAQSDVGPASRSCTAGIVRNSLTGFSGEGKMLMFTLKALPNAPVGQTQIRVHDALIATPGAVAQTVKASAASIKIANSNAAEWWQLYQ